MSIADKRIGFVGVGNMGEALVRGLTKTGVAPVDHLVMTDVRADRVEELKRLMGKIEFEFDPNELRKRSRRRVQRV